MGIAPGLAVEIPALLGKGLLQSDAGLLSGCDQLGSGHFQQAAVGGVGHRLLLHRAVDDHTGEFLRLDDLELGSHVEGLGQQLFHTFLAQQLPELDQGGGVAGQPILVIGAA